MEYSTGQFHVSNAWNQPVEYSIVTWTSIITLGKKIDDEKTLLLKIIWLYEVNPLNRKWLEHGGMSQ